MSYQKNKKLFFGNSRFRYVFFLLILVVSCFHRGSKLAQYLSSPVSKIIWRPMFVIWRWNQAKLLLLTTALSLLQKPDHYKRPAIIANKSAARDGF